MHVRIEIIGSEFSCTAHVTSFGPYKVPNMNDEQWKLDEIDAEFNGNELIDDEAPKSGKLKGFEKKMAAERAKKREYVYYPREKTWQTSTWLEDMEAEWRGQNTYYGERRELDLAREREAIQTARYYRKLRGNVVYVKDFGGLFVERLPIAA